MTRPLRFVPLALALSLLGCPGPAEPANDAAMDAPETPDGGPDVGPDTLPPRTRETIPAAGPLLAGVAEATIPAPVGIGTMGFGSIGAAPSESPFADIFPATTRQHGQLTFRAVALSRGPEHELVLVRMDTVGVFQQLREAVLDAVEARIGRRLDDALVIAGNHTHSGPGRILMATGALTQLGDNFLPEFYDRIVATLADVIGDAIDDMRAAELATVIVHTSSAHDDRRCENDPLPQLQELGDLPLVAVRREGRLDAIVSSYAYHGTVLGIEEHTLSGDMGHVVEERVEERFDHPVTMLFFNSWGADMAPASPTIDPSAVGAIQPDGYERMQALGDVVADAIVPALTGLTYSADVPLRTRTHRLGIDRDWIGYEDNFFPYPNGGVFCGFGTDGVCDRIMPNMSLIRGCIRIQASDGLPHQTLMSAGQVGDLFFVIAPGEWTTALANGVLDHVRATSGAPGAMFIGYANDYTGYSTGEADFWQGGYEASGALWGPRQGDYLAGRLGEVFDTYFGEWNEPPTWREPAPVPPFSGYSYSPYVPETAVMPGTFTANVAATYGQTDIVTFTVNGSDPWLGTPVATLEHDDGTGTFAPVLRPNGVAIATTSTDAWIDLTTAPTYAETERTATRTFGWTVHYPVRSRAGASVSLSGRYRFRVHVPAIGGDLDVTTAAFDVTS
jgi:hypothetical protein